MIKCMHILYTTYIMQKHKKYTVSYNVYANILLCVLVHERINTAFGRRGHQKKRGEY